MKYLLESLMTYGEPKFVSYSWLVLTIFIIKLETIFLIFSKKKKKNNLLLITKLLTGNIH